MSDEQINNQENIEERSATESGHEEDFAQLFEQSTQSVKRLEPGQRVTTRVAGISGDFVYIDLGGKSEGVIDRKEFLNEEGALTLQDGDEIEAYFVTVENGARKFTTLIHSFPSITLQSIRGRHPCHGKGSIGTQGRLRGPRRQGTLFLPLLADGP